MAADPLTALRDEIVAHTGCGFEPCMTASRMVPGEGSPAARVMFVGEAPGATEDELGRPFVGRAGKLLGELLAEAGLVREDVWITNVVKARPPKNRDPKAPEVAHCMPWLERELEMIAAAPGRTARAPRSEALRARREDRRGARDRAGDGRRQLFPLYHPAAAMYNQTLQGDAVRGRPGAGRPPAGVGSRTMRLAGRGRCVAVDAVNRARPGREASDQVAGLRGAARLAAALAAERDAG